MKPWQIIGLISLLSIGAIGYSIKDIPINKNGGTLDEWLQLKKTTEQTDQTSSQPSNGLCSDKYYSTEYTQATATSLSTPLTKITQLDPKSISKLADAIWWEYCNADINFIPKAQRIYDQYGNYAGSTRMFPDYNLVKNENRCLNQYFGSINPIIQEHDPTAPIQLWGNIDAPGEPHSITYFALSTLSDMTCLNSLQLPGALPITGDPGPIVEDLPGGIQMRRWINIAYLNKLPELLLLNLSNYQVKPNLAVLNNLPELKILSLRGTTAKGYQTLPVAPVGHLVNLEVLNLSNTTVKNLSPIQGLSELRLLDISYTLIGDKYFGGLAPLVKLSNLKELYASNVAITNLTALSGLKELQKLNLSYDFIHELTPLKGLSKLRELDISYNKSLFTFGTQANLTALISLTGLERLNLRGTGIGNESCTFLKQQLAKTRINC
ncbi:MAG: hypothetical protein V1807_03105 [Patescibacteria group bacterium]